MTNQRQCPDCGEVAEQVGSQQIICDCQDHDPRQSVSRKEWPGCDTEGQPSKESQSRAIGSDIDVKNMACHQSMDSDGGAAKKSVSGLFQNLPENNLLEAIFVLGFAANELVKAPMSVRDKLRTFDEIADGLKQKHRQRAHGGEPETINLER
jgi:hypothetical protein